jgi:drug/metabolite transporter (DMT)-like permease
LIFLNSYLLNEDGFHYPMTLCSMGLGASWTISSVLVSLGVSKLDKSKDMTTRWYVKHVVPIGGFAAFSLALGNYTYLYLSVSFIQMLKAAVPCVTMLVLVGASLEKPHRVTVLGVAILTFGTALAAYGEIAFQWIGIVLMFSSEFSEACRMAVLQYLLGNLRFELVEGLYVMAPASFGFLVLGIAAFEWDALVAEDGFGKIVRAPHKYICAALLGFLREPAHLGGDQVHQLAHVQGDRPGEEHGSHSSQRRALRQRHHGDASGRVLHQHGGLRRVPAREAAADEGRGGRVVGRPRAREGEGGDDGRK